MKKWMFLVSLCCPAFLMTACGEQNATTLPVETVPVPGKDYAIGKYEVTQAQYAAVMGNIPPDDPDGYAAWLGEDFTPYHKGDNLPVVEVSWDDAMAFCKSLTYRERLAGRLPAGMKYTLPTSAQWEYACRAGTTTEYNTGDGEEALDRAGWFEENSGDKLHPVGQKEPNAWGIYDMHGNVAEWCLDGRGSLRFFRGGGFSDEYGECASSYKSDFPIDVYINSIGFRVVLVPESQ